MHRWSNLARHGLLSTTILGAAASANAKPCKLGPNTTIGFTIGVDFAPKLGVVAGLEMRHCLAETAEGLVRVEFGTDGSRAIVGARARPFEKKDIETWGDYVGAEAGLAVDFLGVPGALGAHIALTYGQKAGYLALAGLLYPSEEDVERPNRGTILGGFVPYATSSGTAGRPLPSGDRWLLPNVVANHDAYTAEDRAVRDHFARSAQLEYSSVWTFLRLAAELAAVGAPSALVARALDAADDEVRHAELCARAAGGLALGQLAMRVAQPRFTRRSSRALATLANEAWLEGCLNEGAAAEEARLAAAEAQGEARSMLEVIARDEAQHAQLAWDVLAWVHSVSPEVCARAIAAPLVNECTADATRVNSSATSATSASPSAPSATSAARTVDPRAVDDSDLARRGIATLQVRRAAWAHAVKRLAEERTILA